MASKHTQRSNSNNLGNDTDSRSYHAARAKRAESLRRMTCLSRRAFEQKHGISASTLQNWEDVNANGLTEKGAWRLIHALKSEGVHCTLEWLMHGIGVTPQVSSQLYQHDTLPKEINAHETNTLDAHRSVVQNNAKNNDTPQEYDPDQHIKFITAELLLFRQHYPNSLDYVVTDDGMAPRYLIGEYVAGIRHFNEAIATTIGLDCIVQTNDGDMLLRTVKKGDLEGHYTLVCSNPQTTVAKPILYNVQLLISAPVIWTRRNANHR